MAKIPEEYAAEMRARGLDPDMYTYDPATKQAQLKKEMSGGEQFLEAGKNILRGASLGVSEPLQFEGRVKEALPFSGGQLAGPAGEVLENYTESLLPEDERVNDLSGPRQFLVRDVMQGVGQIIPMLATGGGLGVASQIPKVGRLAAIALGSMGEGEGTAEAELKRQIDKGEAVNEDVALAKGLVQAPFSAVLESKFGVGRIINKLLGPKVAGNFLRKAAANVATGSGEEATQQLSQDLLVEGKPDLAATARAAGVGGIVQGGLATAADVVGGQSPPPVLDGAGKAASATRGAFGSEFLRGRTRSQTSGAKPTDTTEQATSISDSEIESILLTQRAGKEWKPLGKKQPYDKALSDAVKSGIPLDAATIKRIALAKDPDATLREESVNFIAAEAQRPPTVAETIEAAQETSSELQDLFKKQDKQKKAIIDLQKRLDDTTLNADMRYIAQHQLRAERDRLQVIDNSISALQAAATSPSMQTPPPFALSTDVASPGFYSGENAGTATPRYRPLQRTFEPAGTEIKTDQPTVAPAGFAGEGTPPPPFTLSIEQQLRRRLSGLPIIEGEIIPGSEQSLPPEQPSPLSMLPVEIQQALIDTMEGEQRGPFAPETGAASATESYYSGIDPRTVSDAFKRWFGSSKIVDAEGLPQVVYHGTRSFNEIKSFERGKEVPIDYGHHGMGFYFSDNPRVAEDYASWTDKKIGNIMGPILPVYIRLENPATEKDLAEVSPIYSSSGWFTTREESQRATEALKKKGFDGVVLRNKRPIPFASADPNITEPGGFSTYREIIVFEPNQIKSATGNRGTFDPADSTIYYSGIDLRPISRAIGTAMRIPFAPLHGLYLWTKSHKAKLARNSPTGALVASRIDPWFELRDKLKNQALLEAKKYEKFLANPAVAEFVNDARTASTWDLSTLPPELQAQAAELQKFLVTFHDIQDAAEIWIPRRAPDGTVTYSPPLDSPGYFPFGISPDVYAAMNMAGDEWSKYKQDWMANWKQQRGNMPNWEAEAESAVSNISRSFAAPDIISGEPLFSAVRLPQGLFLPPSWRSKDPYASLVQYIDRWAEDVAYAEIMQKDPAMRRALGIRRTPKGEVVGKDIPEDPLTFAELSDEDALAAFREGERTDAAWIKNTPHDAPINTLTGDENLKAIRHSYMQTPFSGAGSKTEEAAEAFNQLAGATIMQTASAVRDYASAMTTLATYIPLKDTAVAFKELVNLIAHPIAAVRASQRAGAQPVDLMRQEVSGEISNKIFSAIYQTAKGMRYATGRQAADAYGKAKVFGVTRAVVQHSLDNGVMHPLVTEFGPTKLEGLTNEQIAEQTAARIVDRAQPNYDIRGLPAVLLPQNRNLFSIILRLNNWSIARYNKWYEDAVIPLYRGNPSRLLKTLFVGAVLSPIAQEAINKLIDRKPEHLTWPEWLKVDNKEIADKEIWPMIFGYIQAQGDLGVLGDIGYQLSRTAAGKSAELPFINPNYPAWILGTKWLTTIASFADSWRKGYVSAADLGDLAVEMLSSMQDFRILQNITGTDKGRESRREQRVFEEMYGTSPLTLQPVVGEGFRAGMRAAQPFSFSRRLNEATEPADFKQLAPEIFRRGEEGRAPAVRSQLMDDLFYLELAKRRGKEAARRIYKKDLQREEEAETRRAVVEGLTGG